MIINRFEDCDTNRIAFIKLGKIYIEFGTHFRQRMPGVAFVCTKYATGFEVGNSFWGVSYNW